MPKPQIAHPALADARPKDIVILVIGSERSGKSSFINLLLKHVNDSRSVAIGDPDSINPVTTGFERVPFEGQIESQNLHFLHLRNDQRIVVVDTPGIPDSDELPPLTPFSTWIQQSLKNMIFGGLIWVHDISVGSGDSGAQARRKLHMLRSLSGAETFDNVVLLTNKWSRSAKDGKELEKFTNWELSLTEQWGLLLSGGAHMMRLSPDDANLGPKSAWGVIRYMLWRLDMDISIQSLKEIDNRKKKGTLPHEVHGLQQTLRTGVQLQEAALKSLKEAKSGGEAQDKRISDENGELKKLRDMIVLHKADSYDGLLPTFERRLLAFNALVVTQ